LIKIIISFVLSPKTLELIELNWRKLQKENSKELTFTNINPISLSKQPNLNFGSYPRALSRVWELSYNMSLEVLQYDKNFGSYPAV